MARITLLLITLTALALTSTTLMVEEKCGLEAVTSHEVNLFLNSKRNESGKWQTAFSVHADATHEALEDGMVLDLKQVVIKCGEKEMVQVRGVLGQDAYANEKVKEKLFFERGGDSVEFSNDRLTLTRKTGESDPNKGSAITNRPLKDNELFEVRLDTMNTKWTNGIMVGVTTMSPSAIEFTDHLLSIKSGTLVYYSENIYYNGTVSQANFGAKIYKLKVGEKVGVMKEADGTVRFFVNGVDQGTVTTKIHGPVYGVVDVHGKVSQATITSASSKFV